MNGHDEARSSHRSYLRIDGDGDRTAAMPPFPSVTKLSRKPYGVRPGADSGNRTGAEPCAAEVHRERARCDRPIPDGRRCAGVRTPLSVRTARTGFFSVVSTQEEQQAFNSRTFLLVHACNMQWLHVHARAFSIFVFFV